MSSQTVSAPFTGKYPISNSGFVFRQFTIHENLTWPRRFVDNIVLQCHTVSMLAGLHDPRIEILVNEDRPLATPGAGGHLWNLVTVLTLFDDDGGRGL